MPQAIKADASIACITYFQHTRLMSVQRTGDSFTAHPFIFSSAFHLIYIGFFSCIDYIDIFPISTVTGIFPAKLAVMRQSSNSACGLVTVNNLPFPEKRVFFTHNLPLCLFLRSEKAENIPLQADGLLSRRRKKASKRGKEKMYHLKIRQ